MRGRDQIELGVGQYRDAKQAERQRHLVQLLTFLGKSHDADWYVWVVARQRGQHRHDLKQADGKPAACPVRGCDAVQIPKQRRAA